MDKQEENTYPTKLIGDNHQIILNNNSKKIVIFFSSLGMKDGRFDFYHESKKLDSNIIFINNGKNEWYQEGVASLGSTFKNVLTKLKEWIKYLDANEIYTCGEAMGGYGSILYGSHLDAKILAFGTRLALKKPMSKSSSLMLKTIKVNFNLLELIKNHKNEMYLYTGENDYIHTHAASICKDLDLPNIVVKSIRDTGSSVVSHIKKKGLLPKVLKSFINNQTIENIPEEGEACEILGFATLYLKQAHSFNNKEWEKSVGFGLRAVSKYPTASRAQNMLGVAYLQISEYLDALGHLSIARSLDPQNLAYQFTIANYMRRTGMLEKSKELHLKILDTNKNFAKSHYDLALTYDALNDKENALQSAQFALGLTPENKSFKQKVIELESRWEMENINEK